VVENWPFTEPENLAVITLKQIVHQGWPILHVVHDKDDGGWQFLGYDAPSEEDAAVVALRTIVRLDQSVSELADLPPDWHAWRRAPGEPWQRARISQ
jgi:hypothetical protein